MLEKDMDKNIDHRMTKAENKILFWIIGAILGGVITTVGLLNYCDARPPA